MSPPVTESWSDWRNSGEGNLINYPAVVPGTSSQGFSLGSIAQVKLPYGWGGNYSAGGAHIGMLHRIPADQDLRSARGLRGVEPSSIQLSKSLRNSIAQLEALPEGWDGEGTRSIRPDAIKAAKDALCKMASGYLNFRDPFLVPKFDGLLQMEWNGDGWSLEIELLGDRWEILGVKPGSREPEYLSAEAALLDFEKLRNYYNWWLERRAQWVA